MPTTRKECMPLWPSSVRRWKGSTAEDFIERDKFVRIGRAPLMVDILLSGVDFDRAWQKRIAAEIDPQSGLTALFISSEDLITTKLAAGRPQDIADVAALREAAESREPEAGKRKRPAKPTAGSPRP